MVVVFVFVVVVEESDRAGQAYARTHNGRQSPGHADARVIGAVAAASSAGGVGGLVVAVIHVCHAHLLVVLDIPEHPPHVSFTPTTALSMASSGWKSLQSSIAGLNLGQSANKFAKGFNSSVQATRERLGQVAPDEITELPQGMSRVCRTVCDRPAHRQVL